MRVGTATMITQYWDSYPPPPPLLREATSFEANNPGYPYRLFSSASAEAFIAEHFSARELRAFRSCALAAMQADYFRYCAVFVLGGLYADADWRCVRSLQPLLERDDDGVLFGRREFSPAFKPYAQGIERIDGYRSLVNGVFAFTEARHPFLQLAIEVATANIERRTVDGAGGVWLTTGPGVFTALYLFHRLGSAQAFARYCSGTALEPIAGSVSEAFENHPDALPAIGRLQVEPREQLRTWLKPWQLPPEYCINVHWTKPRGSIFR